MKLLHIQTSKSATVESTGLTKYAIYQANLRKNIYNEEQLTFILNLIIDLEQGIKNGTYEEPKVVDYLLAKIF